jgi:uncharacterized hydrophobic protein (TIGR00271 family)
MSARFHIAVSDARAEAVGQEIALGSDPRLRFYLMVAASTMLASLGLIMNSTAVVIGAMLVAPLMTPIFGIALALVRGDTHLLSRSMQAEAVGVVLAILLALLLGLLIPELAATEEIMARTKPNLFDLLVALFAGFAGAYAMVDENISPALPGVAIATAIVPPLATTGLSLALGNMHWALGSFLLFFANFLSILLVASIVFMAAKVGRDVASPSTRDIVARFSLATIGFCVLAVFLSRTLLDIVREQHLQRTIEAVLDEQLTHLPASDIQKIIFLEHDEKIYCLAHIYASSFITPARVKSTELAMERALDRPVELFFRSTLSKDVSATGSFNQVNAQTLDGFYVGQSRDPSVDLIQTAEQTLREFLSVYPTYKLEHVNLLTLRDQVTIMASIYGPRKFKPEQINEIEQRIRTISGRGNVNLVIRHINVHLYDNLGDFKYEWLSVEPVDEQYQREIDHLRTLMKTAVSALGLDAEEPSFTVRENVLHLLLEVTGVRLFTQPEFEQLQSTIKAAATRPVQIYVRTRPDTVLTSTGQMSFTKLQDDFMEQARTLYTEDLQQMGKDAL